MQDAYYASATFVGGMVSSAGQCKQAGRFLFPNMVVTLPPSSLLFRSASVDHIEGVKERESLAKVIKMHPLHSYHCCPWVAHSTDPRFLTLGHDCSQAQQAPPADPQCEPSPSRHPQPTDLLPLPSPEATLALIKARRSVFPKDYNGQKLTKQQVRVRYPAGKYIALQGTLR